MKKYICIVLILISLSYICYATEVNWTPYQEEELSFWSINNDTNIELAAMTTTGTLIFCFEDTQGNGVTVSLDEIVRVLNLVANEFGSKIVIEK